MFRVRVVSVPLVALAASFWPAQSSAQTPPPEAAADEDLEVPASSTPAATQSPTVPAPTTSPSSAAPSEQPAPPTTAAVDAPAGAALPAPTTPPAAVSEPVAPPAAKDSWLDGLLFKGYVQGQYQRNALSEDQLQQSGAPLNQNQFLVRRARLRLDRVWDYAAAAVELDANTVRGPRVGIRRAEASLFYRGRNAKELPPLIALSAGVMDIPFGFELNQSARVRYFMERSQGNLALFPTEPDAGAKLSGAVSFMRYAVAFMNGEPVDDSGFPRDPNNKKEAIARFGAEGSVAEKLQLNGGTSFAYGKGFHAGQSAGKPGVIWTDTNEDGTHQPGEIIGVPGAAATPSENFERWALGVDLGVSLTSKLGRSHVYGEAFIASNYDRGYSPSDPIGSGVDARQLGAHVSLTHELLRYGVVGFRFSYYDPNSDIIEVRGGRALPKTQKVKTFSPLIGLVLPERARLVLQYDFVRDFVARDAVGVPSDADNDQFTARLQVEL